MLAKHSVKMDLLIDSYHYNPGDKIKGMLRLDIKSKIPVTGVRVSLVGKEKVSFKSDQGKREGEHIHFKKIVTVFGFSIESGRKGGAQLEAGTYAYPFSFDLPPSIPPSFYCSLKKGEASLVYKIKALIDIPKGFDATKEKVIIIRSCAPVAQVQALAAQGKDVEDNSLSTETKGCCSTTKSKLEVRATLFPGVLVVKPDENSQLDHYARAEVEKAYEEEAQKGMMMPVGQDASANGGFDPVTKPTSCYPNENPFQTPPVIGAPNDYYANHNNNVNNNVSVAPNPPPQPVELAPAPAGSLTVRLRLKTSSSWKNTKIGKVVFAIEEMRLLSFNGESISEVFPIATHSFTIAAKAQNGHLEELTIQLPFPKELAYAKGAGKTAPLPTMATEYMEAHLMARITFPDNKQLSTIQSKGDVFFVTQVEDEVGRAPPLPVRYVDAVLLPEDDYMKL